MVKLDMFCGLLGAGKTTLIKRMLATTYAGYKVAIIENEFGKINLDAAELESASIQVRELTSGCVCCTVKGDLMNAVDLLIQQEKPDYIVVEASGAADLRSLLAVCRGVEGVSINRVITVVHGKKIVLLLKVIGEFFKDQIRISDTIYLNFCGAFSRQEEEAAMDALREINPGLHFVSATLEQITADTFPDRPAHIPAAPKPMTPKPFGRLVAGRPLGQLRRSSTAAAPELKSWTVTFDHPLSKMQLQQLLELIQDGSHQNIWRAKGYLELDDGTIRKVDYTFGDTFEEVRELIPEEHKNVIVLIGPELDTDWFDRQLEALFAN